MSDRFWNRHLRHLRPNQGRSTDGIRGKNGSTVYRVQIMPAEVTDKRTENQKLLDDLYKQKQARQGKQN